MISKLKKPVSILLSLIMVFSLFTIVPLSASAAVGDTVPESEYLTFTAEEAGSSVTLNVSTGSNLQYNINNSGWQSYTAGTPITLENAGDSVRFSGTGTKFNSSKHFSITGKVACSGNVMSLRLDDGGRIQGLENLCFRYMFYNCTGLTTAPDLPETDLKAGCYSNMFNGCTSLTTAPELPATTLAESCYSNMFNGCTSLTTAPDLPATTLAESCYSYMFNGCTSLTTAPDLWATTLASNCYQSMFNGCMSLTEAPELPATTLANYCYQNMFKGCERLTEAPELPATTLASYCYSNMFRDCKSLTEAPELPATNLAQYCYASMFMGCTSLTKAPELPATNLAESCYYNMFYFCKSLTELPALPATTLARSCYSYMFYGCSNIRISDEADTFDDITYSVEYRIPTTGEGTSATNALTSMFTSTGGEFTGTPNINTTYYVPAPAPTYTVTWKNGDTVLETDTDVAEGTTPTYDGEDPTKADAVCCTFTFAGWNDGTTTYAPDALPAVNGDVTYTAVFTDAPKDGYYKATAGGHSVYSIVPLGENIDGGETYPEFFFDNETEVFRLTSLKNCKYYYYDENGTDLTASFVKSASGDYYVTVTQDPMPTIVLVKPVYTIMWNNWDDTPLSMMGTDVIHGETPEYEGEDPTREADAINTYTFSGWTPQLAPATDNATYKATFTAGPKPHTHGGITFDPWTSTNSLPATAGNYYLANDVTLSGTWTVPGGTTNLCLNGHGIIRTGSGRVIDLSSSGRNLNIYDCDTVTEHRFTVNNPTENGAGVAVVNDDFTENYQTFTGGYITGGNTNNGAGIHVYQATLKLYGGTVIGNSNTGDGGGIYVEKGGNLYIDGGTVSYNQARQGGGIYAPNIASYAKIHLNSGRIEKNYATYTGGGVYGGASVPVYLEGSIVVTGNYSLNAAGVTAAWNNSGARIYVSGSPYVYDNFNANGQSNLSGAYYENTMQITGNLGADCKVGLNAANGLLNYYKSDYTHTGIDPNVLFPYDNNNYILAKDGNNAKRIQLYTITFKNDDEVLQTSKVISGETPEYKGATPTKPADAQYVYTFAGWKDDTTTYAPDALPAVTGDTTYTAVFTATPKKLFVGNTITLNADIGVNFFINSAYADFAGAETATVVFTWDSGNCTKVVNLKELTKESGCYKATCDVVAAHMAHEIHAVVYLNGTALDETEIPKSTIPRTDPTS